MAKKPKAKPQGKSKPKAGAAGKTSRRPKFEGAAASSGGTHPDPVPIVDVADSESDHGLERDGEGTAIAVAPSGGDGPSGGDEVIVDNVDAGQPVVDESKDKPTITERTDDDLQSELGWWGRDSDSDAESLARSDAIEWDQAFPMEAFGEQEEPEEEAPDDSDKLIDVVDDTAGVVGLGEEPTIPDHDGDGASGGEGEANGEATGSDDPALPPPPDPVEQLPDRVKKQRCITRP